MPLAVLGAAVGAIWVSAWSGAASATFGDPPAARPAGGSGRKNILPARISSVLKQAPGSRRTECRIKDGA